MTRVAFITEHIPPYRTTFYDKLCNACEMEWLVIHGQKQLEDGRPSYTGEVAFPNARVKNREWALGPYKIRWQKGAFKEVLRFNPNVVVMAGICGILSNWLIMLWARLKGRSCVLWSCGWEAQRPGSLALRFKQFFMHAHLSAASLHVVYGTKAKRYLQALGIPESKIIVCYNGIETDHLAENESEILREARKLRSELVPSGDALFVFVGGLAADKRVNLLLQAFEILAHSGAQCTLWIVGDGPEKARLQNRTSELGLEKVRFLGRVVQGVDPIFAAADCLVLPGTGGLALNQALYWRVPCIVGEADGTEDDLVVDSQTGFRFDPGDTNSLAHAMTRLILLGPEDRRAMGERGRRLIERRSNVNTMISTFAYTLGGLTRYAPCRGFSDRPAPPSICRIAPGSGEDSLGLDARYPTRE